MKRNKLLIAILIGIIMFGGVDCRKNSRNRGSRPASRTTPRPRHTTTHRDPAVDPNKIGWAVPGAGTQTRPSSGNVGPKPSAPLPDQSIAKSNAPSLQSGYPGQNQHNQPNYNGHNQPMGQGYNPPVGQPYNPSVALSYPQSAGQPYNPSVGQSYHQPSGQSYNPSVGGQSYHQSAGQPYNPSVGGQSYHQPAGQPYNPSYGQPYHQPAGQPYNPPVGQPYQQPIGQPYNPPVGQTVILAPAQASGSSNRGLGQIAKEAVVFAGVSAGVNAAVNRLLPGGSRGGGSTSNTQITYNNYYNNQTDSQGNPVPPPAATGETSSTAKPAESSSSAPANPMGPQVTAAPEIKKPDANPNPEEPLSVIPLNGDVPKPVPEINAPMSQPSGNPMAPPAQTNLVSNEELIKLSEELFNADANNAYKYITLKLQGQKTDDSVTDSATEPLLTVQPEALQIPTIASLRSLYDKYELDSKVAEKVTPEKRDAETNLINAFFATEVMSKAMKFVAEKGLIPNDEYEFKDALKRIWFSQYARENNIISSSGFESVFLAEKVHSDVTGLHNWIYFNEQESAGRANYLGYIKEAKLGSNAAIVKFRATLNDIVRPVTTIFVGTSPELEMALYTDIILREFGWLSAEYENSKTHESRVQRTIFTHPLADFAALFIISVILGICVLFSTKSDKDEEECLLVDESNRVNLPEDRTYKLPPTLDVGSFRAASAGDAFISVQAEEPAYFSIKPNHMESCLYNVQSQSTQTSNRTLRRAAGAHEWLIRRTRSGHIYGKYPM